MALIWCETEAVPDLGAVDAFCEAGLGVCAAAMIVKPSANPKQTSGFIKPSAKKVFVKWGRAQIRLRHGMHKSYSKERHERTSTSG